MNYNFYTYKRELNIIGRDLAKTELTANYINFLLLKLKDIEKRLNVDLLDGSANVNVDSFSLYLIKKDIKKIKAIIGRKANE